MRALLEGEASVVPQARLFGGQTPSSCVREPRVCQLGISSSRLGYTGGFCKCSEMRIHVLNIACGWWHGFGADSDY